MHPFFTIFGKTISAYWLAGVLGFGLSLFWIILATRRDKVRRDNAIYIYVLGMIGVLIGAKALYIITVFPQFVSDLRLLPHHMTEFLLRYFTGGMVFFGGLLGGIAAAWAAAHAYKVRLSVYCDLLVPAVIMTAGCGRIGCFLAGCCYGKPADPPFGMVFAHSLAGAGSQPVLPTQLYEAVFDFVLLVVILVLIRRGMRGIRLLDIYLFSYCIFRFFNEFLRGDSERGFLGVFSISQWIALAIIITLSGYLTLKYKHRTLQAS